MLAIDPEDLQAHYNLMHSYRGAGDNEMAQEHEARYRRCKADESSQQITGPYRQLHPHDNNERQAVHEHGSALEGTAHPPAGRYRAAQTALRGNDSAGSPASQGGKPPALQLNGGRQ